MDFKSFSCDCLSIRFGKVGTFFYISHTCLVKQVHVWNAMWNNLCTLTHSVLRQCLLMRRLKKFLSRNCWLTLIVKKVCRSIQRFLFGLDATSVKHISCVRFAISFLTAFLNVRKKPERQCTSQWGCLVGWCTLSLRTTQHKSDWRLHQSQRGGMPGQARPQMLLGPS